ncbi:MAG: spore cortex biosynthesis protein YabQ, partial [Lachnospiraceae bacterium]
PKIACDIVFSLVSFTFLFIALYYITAFRLRIYHFTGIAAGFLLFVLCVMPLLKYIKQKINNIRLEILRKKKYNKK